MTDITVDAVLSVKDAGVTRPMTPADLKGDPAAGPGALDASVLAVRDAVAAVQAAVTDGTTSEHADLGTTNTKLDQVTAAVAAVEAAVNAQSGGASGATEATLDAVLAKLPANPSTEATVAAILAKLPADAVTNAALGALLGVPASDDVLTLLRQVATNTATEAVRTDTLHLDAQQVDLDVQGVESRLDTANARLGTAATPGSLAALIDAVRLAMSDGTQRQATDGVAGGALPARRLLIAGSDGNVVRELAIDANGAVGLQSGGAPGQNAPARAVEVGGVDAGGLLRALLLRASGAQVVDSDTLATEATQQAIRNRLPAALDASGNLKVSSNPSAFQLVTKTIVATASGGTNVGDGTGTAELMALVRPGDTQFSARTVAAFAFLYARMPDGTWTTLYGYVSTGGGASPFWTNTTSSAGWVTGPIPPGVDAIRIVQSSGGGAGGTRGDISTGPGYSGSLASVAAAAIGMPGDSNTSMTSAAGLYGLNQTGNWDRWRNTYQSALLPSAARTASATSSANRTWNTSALVVTLNVTSATGVGGLTLRIEAQDMAGAWRTVLADTAPVTASGNYAYEVALGSAAAAGAYRASISRAVPYQFRVVVTHGDASSYTYSVNYDLTV